MLENALPFLCAYLYPTVFTEGSPFIFPQDIRPLPASLTYASRFSSIREQRS